jgi:dTDP-4-dehydrorhamnose reductase
MRWLVIGAGGMLGWDLQRSLAERDVVATKRRDLDITDYDAALEVIMRVRPDVVVNSAAWTAVDAAETDEAGAFAVNAIGAANVAQACSRIDARMVHVSTDYVFDGTASTPYPEHANVCPRSAYGRTKAAGEWAVRSALPQGSWIVRTAWLYGEAGQNFVRRMIQLEAERDSIDVVDDQRGQPTWSAEVARQIVKMMDADVPPGIFHATATGSATWYDLARSVFELLGTDPDRVRPTDSTAFARPAPRPAYSVLSHDAWARAGLVPLPHWKASLSHAFDALASAR